MNKLSITLALTLALSATLSSCGITNVTVEVPENYVKLLEVGDYGLDDNEDGYKKKTMTAVLPMSLQENNIMR